MSKRAALVRRLAVGELEPPASPERLGTGDVETIGEVTLPRDHPKWMRDRFTISAMTKGLIDRLKPVAIRVFAFWDHRVHRIDIDEVALEIDPTGSYRCDLPPAPLKNLRFER